MLSPRRRDLKRLSTIGQGARDGERVKKVVLAYSGGLDTSVILRWLQETYRCEVVTFTADLGQGEELEPARKKAELMGVKEIFIDDLREEFVRDFVFPMFRANALYEGQYLLGTSIARPLIAKRQIEIANAGRRRRGRPRRHRQGQRPGALRARLLRAEARHQGHRAVARMGPRPRAPRSSNTPRSTRSRSPSDKRGEAPFSVDANLLHISAEGKVLEDPWVEPEEFVYSRTVAPEKAPDQPEYVEIEFQRGDAVAVDGDGAVAGGAADAAQRAGRRARHRPARSGREPLRRHEVARRLRDAGRHHPARGPSRHREHHPRPRRGASQGRADAALCRAHLQRLLVRARARDAAGADRQEPGACRGHGAAQALQGPCRASSAASRRNRSTASPTSPSRKTRSTTSATPRASSS